MYPGIPNGTRLIIISSRSATFLLAHSTVTRLSEFSIGANQELTVKVSPEFNTKRLLLLLRRALFPLWFHDYGVMALSNEFHKKRDILYNSIQWGR